MEEAIKTDQEVATGEAVNAQEAATGDINYAEVYAEMYEKEKAAREKAEADRDNYKKGLLIAKGKMDEDEEPSDLDSLVEKKVQEQLAAVSPPVRQSMDSLIGDMTTDPNLKRLIKYHYDNSVVHHGDDMEAIKTDLQNARMIATNFLASKKEVEMKAALNAKNTMPKISSGAGDAGDIKRESTFTKDQLEFIAKRAKALGTTPDKFAEQLKGNLQALRDKRGL